MLGAQYSPQVVNSLSKASGLVSQLRKVMTKVECCQNSNIPVPVKLAKRAQVLIDHVGEWENRDVQIENTCPMRFTPQVVSTSSSPHESPDETSISKWGIQRPPNSASKSSSSMKKKMKCKYRNQWDNLQKRQMMLYESS